VSEEQFQLLRGAGFVAAVTLALLLQRLSPHASVRGSWRVNGALWLVNLIVTGFVCGACACTVARWAAGAGFGALRAVAVPRWLAIATTLVTLDVVSYGWHRANHRLPFLWRFHEIHHRDRFLDTTSALRFHFGEVALTASARAVIIVLFTIPLTSVLTFEALVLGAAIFHHSDLKLPPRLERALSLVIVTPSIHWVHHHRVRRDTDANYSTILSLWDRLFASKTPTHRTPEMEIGVQGEEELTLPELLLRPFLPRQA